VIAEALAHEAGGVDVALFNAGSVRIDDVLPAGPITEYDIIRVLPVRREGRQGERRRRAAGARARDRREQRGHRRLPARVGRAPQDGAWLVQGRPIDPARRYASR
jgi:5'-nucleotidase